MTTHHVRRWTLMLGAAGVFAAAGAAQTAEAASEAVLYNFGVVKGGRNPEAALTLGCGGKYYGTATGGGATGNGVVFELTPPAAGQTAWTRKVIYAFSGASDGSFPSSGLLADASGALYGVTGSGGAAGAGTAFKLTPPASGQKGWTETTLHSFNGASDGAAPFGTLVEDKNGVLYGSTAGGGSTNSGVVFSLTPPSGSGDWMETPLYTFQGGSDGASPSNGLYLDPATGALYGLASVGGLKNAGEAYQIAPPSDGGTRWKKTAIYNFAGGTDGNYPVGALVPGADGTLYGVTNGGGVAGFGTAFSLSPPASGKTRWSEAVLYSFTGGNDGASPSATPVLGPDGTLYGTANGGGSAGAGAIFALTPRAGGHSWSEQTLVSLTGPNGNGPAGLTLDSSGFLIGTTVYGGTRGNGGGIVYTLTPPQSGGGWTQDVIVQFADISAGPSTPAGDLLVGKGGLLYGSASNGGAHGQGAVYQLTPPAAGKTDWQATILHSFNGQDGSQAVGKLLPGPHGSFYGVTSSGGPESATPYGVVYALLPPKAGKTDWTVNVLHAFTGVGTGDGAFPATGLIADSSGALYGTTGSGGIPTSDDSFGNGIVYKLSPPASGQGPWTETILYSFSGPDGSTPQAELLADKNGALYGTTYTGGSAGEGTVFELTPPSSGSGAWSETVLHSFNASVHHDGAIPGNGQLVSDPNGVLYGVASQGGANNVGMVFSLAPPASGSKTWTETSLHNFTGTDGATPFNGLLRGRNGTLYGVAQQGGTPPGCFSPFGSGCGTVFRLTPSGSGAKWGFKVLHDFQPVYGTDGAQPDSTPVFGPNGVIIGTTAAGGFGSSGVAFSVTP